MATFKIIAAGFGGIEAPTLDVHGALYFSDVHDGGVYRLTPDGGTTTIVPRRKAVGGICLHADGGIVISGRDVAHVMSGASRILLSRADFAAGGNPVSSFNDLCADRSGRIFVGVIRRRQIDGNQNAGYEKYRQNALAPSELVVLGAPGRTTDILADVSLPNGTAMSPDGTLLYHADTYQKRINILEFSPGGAGATRIGQFSTSALPGGPDGIAIDEEGGIWTAQFEGGCVARFTPEGRLDRRIEAPSASPLSLCFAGADLKTLIVTTQNHSENPRLGACILAYPASVAGAAVYRARL